MTYVSNELSAAHSSKLDTSLHVQHTAVVIGVVVNIISLVVVAVVPFVLIEFVLVNSIVEMFRLGWYLESNQSVLIAKFKRITLKLDAIMTKLLAANLHVVFKCAKII